MCSYHVSKGKPSNVDIFDFNFRSHFQSDIIMTKSTLKFYFTYYLRLAKIVALSVNVAIELLFVAIIPL